MPDVTALGPLRVLDLTDERGSLCASILGSHGADVIKVESPAGSTERRQGPFVAGVPGPERGLPWLASNTNKRGVTLNLEQEDGQEIFRRLATAADFVIESFAPGYLDGLGLGYANLAATNPRLIMASIAPFGQHGPYRDYAASDLVLLALGGLLFICGDQDRSPVRIGVDQAYSHGAVQAALACLIALHERGRTGRGQYLDVSVQEAVASARVNVIPLWELRGAVAQRGSRLPYGEHALTRVVWPCRDGHIAWKLYVGKALGLRNAPLLAWMAAEGFSSVLSEIDWEALTTLDLTQPLVDSWEEQIGAFFLTQSRSALYEGAIARQIMLFPLLAPADLLENEQLAARGFWQQIEHPNLESALTYPGPAVAMSKTPARVGRPPCLDEHTQTLLRDELGFSTDEIGLLYASGAI